jgi:uncharacterized protein YdaU (DUF1376 family)
MKYYRRYAGDYLRDTLNLTWLQDCAYTRLLDHQYSTEQKINSLEDAQRIARASALEEKEAVEFIFVRYFPDGVNPRLEHEIRYAESRRTHAQSAAKTRWGKISTGNNAPSIAGALHEQSSPSANGHAHHTPNGNRSNGHNKLSPEESVKPSENTMLRAFPEHCSTHAIPDSRLQTIHKTPLPPTNVGGETIYDYQGTSIAVQLGRHKRLPKIDGAGSSMFVKYYVERLNSLGFPCRVVEKE